MDRRISSVLGAIAVCYMHACNHLGRCEDVQRLSQSRTRLLVWDVACCWGS